MLGRTSLSLACISALASGCALVTPDRIHYRWDETEHTPCKTCAPAERASDFVGIALSGGGARAAVFAAAGLEVLAEAGVLPHATHISSVSGGGFAASYYLLHRPSSAEEFTAFKDTMRRNYLAGTMLRQVTKPNRFSSPTRRLSSLKDALDDAFLNEATFGDISAAPILLINAARYDDGRRFVFSNLPIPEEAPGFAPYTEDVLRTASFSLPGCPRATPGEFSVALAVAISAAFPPILGPATLEAPASCDGGVQYWHLGDGGIIENKGVETLEEIALRQPKAGPPLKRVLILSLDAGREASPEKMMQDKNLSLWTSNPGRVVDLATLRGDAWREVAREEMKTEFDVPVEVIKMRYTDAQVAEWPASCGDRDGGVDEIADHIAAIPTSLKISDCDADLMEEAARELVERTVREWYAPD